MNHPDEVKFPEVLYVGEKNASYSGLSLGKYLVGSGYLESAIPSGVEQTVATYRLVEVKKYKKTTTIETTVQEVT